MEFNYGTMIHNSESKQTQNVNLLFDTLLFRLIGQIPEGWATFLSSQKDNCWSINYLVQLDHRSKQVCVNDFPSVNI